jgi:hypothetical protein
VESQAKEYWKMSEVPTEGKYTEVTGKKKGKIKRV